MVGAALTHVPQDIKVHKKRVADLHNKQVMFETGKNLDWYASFLNNNTTNIVLTITSLSLSLSLRSG